MILSMSVDPVDDFVKKPLREQLDTLVKVYTRGGAPSWLTSTALIEALLMRILIESSHRLERLTRWLIGLTIVLAVLTAVLAYGESRHLVGN